MTLDELVEKGKKLYKKVHKPLKLGLAGLTLATNLYATDTLQVDVNQEGGKPAQAQTQLEVNGEQYQAKTNEKGIATIIDNFTNETAIQEEPNQPNKFKLENPYPNPSNDTQIDFHLQENGKTTISVYNTLGQKLTQTQKHFQKGENSAKININAASGTYLINIKSPSGKMETVKYTHLGNGPGTANIQKATPNKNNNPTTRQNTKPTLAKIANQNGTLTIQPDNPSLKDTTYQTQLQEGLNKEQIQLQQKPPIEKTIQFIRLFKDFHGGTNKGFIDPTSGVHATIQDSTYISGKNGKIHLKLKPNTTNQDSILITKPSQDSVFLDQKFPITWLNPKKEEKIRKQMTVEDPYGPNKWDKIEHWDNILERTIYMTWADLAGGKPLRWYNKEKGKKMDSIPYYIQDKINFENSDREFHYKPAVDSAIKYLNNKIKKYAGTNHDQLTLLTKTQDSSHAAKHGATYNLQTNRTGTQRTTDDFITNKKLYPVLNATVYLPYSLGTTEDEDTLITETLRKLIHEHSRLYGIRGVSPHPKENMIEGGIKPKPWEYMTKHMATNYKHNHLLYFKNYEKMEQEVDSLRKEQK